MQVRSLGQEDSLEKEIAPLSNILAWRIPRTEEPGGYSPGVTKSQTQAKRERARMQSLPRNIQISEALNSRIRS